MKTYRNIRNAFGAGSLSGTVRGAACVLRRVVLTACVIVGALSCHRRPLEDPDLRTAVKITIDTDGIQNVTCDVYNPNIPLQKIEPTVMHVIFYDAATDNVVSENFLTGVSTDDEGRRVISGEVQLAPGEYRMLAYDFGTEEAKVKDYYLWGKTLAYTDPVPSSVLTRFATKGEDTPNIIREPEHLEVARKEQESIPYHDAIWTVEATARSVVESWYIQVHVDGVQWVNSAQAVLSGMASGNYIEQDLRVTEPEATAWFALKKSQDAGKDVVCTVFNTFGHIPDATDHLEITFDVSTVDKKIIRKTFDITELFKSENAVKHHWLLIDETIKVEPPESSGGAFDPKIDDWDEEHREIDI